MPQSKLADKTEPERPWTRRQLAGAPPRGDAAQAGRSRWPVQAPGADTPRGRLVRLCAQPALLSHKNANYMAECFYISTETSNDLEGGNSKCQWRFHHEM